ncbi:MAG: cell division protein FtsA [Caldilinea sp.]|nr:cell division protein FtsA [Caldilinea sp.]MDW8439249.1 cell division protein FtsA [Caldilineaceae bacterium]
MEEFVSAIDIGTTKICVLTAQVTHDSLGRLSLRMLGEGVAPSRGIRRGVVVDVPEATAAIGEAIERCEQDAGRRILSAYVGIAGSHIGTRNSRGVSPVDRRIGVTGADMQRALEGARAVALPENQEVIHTIARSWTVDGETEVQQPLGMSAYRLEVDAHIVTGSSTAINNLVQCVTAHGVDIDELVLEPLAANEAVLRPEERRMGVAVVDMGGGTSDLAIFIDNALCHTVILDMGGNHLTNDVAVGLRCPFETAEEIKLRYGSLLPERIAPDETVWATVFGEKSERSFSRRFICDVLEARAMEMLEIIAEKLSEAGYLDRLPAGLVLTGGCSQLPGFAELGRKVLGMPVRIGAAHSGLPILGLTRSLLNPSHATSVGLLLWGLHEDARAVHRRFGAEHVGPSAQKWMGAAAKWLKTLLPDRD